jgi:hypothetical protein
MKGIIISCGLLLGTMSILAQDVTSSKEMVNKYANAFFNSFLGQDSNGNSFVLRKEGSVVSEAIVLEKYDASLNFVKGFEVPSTIGLMGDVELHRKTVMDNGRIYHFYEGWNKADGKNSYIVKVSDETGAIAEEDFVLETEPSKSQLKSAKYSLRFSPDGSKLAILTNKPFVKKGKEEVRVQVFSTKDFQSIWSKDIILDNESKRFPSNELVLNNLGVAAIFKDIKVSNKEHIVQWISVQSTGHKVETLELNGMYCTSSKMLVNKDDDFVVVGMLVEPGPWTNTWQNILHLSSYSDGRMKSLKSEPLGADLLGVFLTEKQSQKKDFKLIDYVLKDVLLRADGGLTLITEYQKITKKNIGTAESPKYDHLLTFGGILIVSFDNLGNRLWHSYYDKEQVDHTRNPLVNFVSFAYALNSNDDLFLIWNYTGFKYESRGDGYRYWIDKSGAKMNIDNIYGAEALYPTLLTKISSDGVLENTERTFSSIPLKEIQKPNAYPMGVDPSIFISVENGMILLSRMKFESAKRYKFNTITFE